MVDTFEERFGLRKVTACGNSICVNDEPIKLKGYCRHDIEANYGPHMPKILVKRRMRIDVSRYNALEKYEW